METRGIERRVAGAIDEARYAFLKNFSVRDRKSRGTRVIAVASNRDG